MAVGACVRERSEEESKSSILIPFKNENMSEFNERELRDMTSAASAPNHKGIRHLQSELPLENMLDQRVKAPCESSEAGISLVAVAIDKGKSSQSALKWALDNLVHRGQTITLLHVNTKGNDEAATAQAMELLIPFRCFCTRKDVKCKDEILEGTDIAKAIVEFLLQASIDRLVIGSQSKGGFVRLKSSSDVPSSISKSAPDFCSVYIISKGKVTSVRNAVRPSPPVSSLRGQILTQPSIKLQVVERPPRDLISEEREIIRSPFTRSGPNQRSRMEISVPEIDISFVSSEISFPSSGRPSLDRSPLQPRPSNASSSLESGFEFMGTPNRSEKLCEFFGNSYSQENLQNMEDVEAEMKRLRLELKHTMDMYSNACREAISAKQKATELHRWKMQEENRLEKARLAEETALAMVEREKAKAKAAIEAAEALKRIAELEAKKRLDAEMKAVKEAEEKNKALNALHNDILRYRKYSIEEIELATDCFAESQKIGGGSYGPVYFGQLDHTPVAIKVLRPDASQSRLQFHKEAFIVEKYKRPLPKVRSSVGESGRDAQKPLLPGTLTIAQLQEIMLLHQGKSADHKGPMDIQNIAKKIGVDAVQVEQILQFISLPPEQDKNKSN